MKFLLFIVAAVLIGVSLVAILHKSGVDIFPSRYDRAMKMVEKAQEAAVLPEKLELVNRAIDLYPRLEAARFYRHRLYREQGEYAKALNDLDSVILRNRRNNAALVSRAEILFLREEVDAALNDLKTVLRRSPLELGHSSNDLLSSARGLQRMSSFGSSDQDVFARAYLLRAQIRFAQGDRELALADVNTAKRCNPDGEGTVASIQDFVLKLEGEQ